LTNNTPNGGQLAISGSFAYDNTFLVDGVDVNDNLFGSANALYIEDAVEQTQVLTSGISAEYGRFSGGVVNAITKSGGDIFSGSYRLNLTNDSWTKLTPYEVTRNQKKQDKLNHSQEMTLGGPILRSKLWFFAAGRFETTDNAAPLAQTGIQARTTDDNKRGEIKITATPWQNHTIWGSYLKVSDSALRPAFNSASLATIDPNTFETPNFPNDGVAVGYRGVLSPRSFLELRYSEKKFAFDGAGGKLTNIVDSPIVTLTQAQLGVYNGAYFDATDPEHRDNWQVAGNYSYFLTAGKGGNHDLKGGFEIYQSKRTGGNSQSASNYVFDADYATADDGITPLYDANNRLIPIFDPDNTLIEHWIASRGAELKIKTTSLYAQDQWRANRHLTVNLGIRYEKVRSDATGGIIGVDTDTVVPRLAATYDINGDGRYVLQATYGHYAGKYSEAQFGNNTTVGNPAQVLGVYAGPPGQGRDFAAGFNPDNYDVFQGTFPTANVFFDKNLSSPVTKEFTLQAGAQLRRGYTKVVYTHRSIGNFVEDFTTTAQGHTEVIQDGVDYGPFDNILFKNSDLPVRKYDGLVFFGHYPVTSRWTLEGSWTVQLRNEGNFEGEGANTPGISSRIGDYPEIFNEARSYPTGNLAQFQRNKFRLYSIYTVPLARFGSLDAGVIYRYDSPRVYSLRSNNVPLSSVQVALADQFGYVSPPPTQTLYYVGKGTEFFKPGHLVDLSLNYTIPVFKTLRPWIKFEALNLFNYQTLGAGNGGWRTTVNPDRNSPLDSLGLPTGYIKSATFGTALDATSYPIPRRWDVAFGVRF
jgi:hypothetical protein